MKNLFTLSVLLMFLGLGSQVFGQSINTAPGITPADDARGNTGVVAGALAPPTYPKFISYPTSHVQPTFIDSGDPAGDQLLHDLRLQHWYFIFDQAEYQNRYGSLPNNLPEGLTPSQYAASPPSSAFSADLEEHFNPTQQPGQGGR